MRITPLLLTIILFLIKIPSHAYDNEFVHQNINRNAALQSDNLIETLNILGFEADAPEVLLEQLVAGNTIRDWFEDGAKLEDETVCRSRNHFHDPTKPWDEAELSNVKVDAACFALFDEGYFVDSSLIWAQKLTENEWSWTKAREYYFQALTNTNINAKEEAFAKTFRAVGQIMHLLADSSVPAHVRNDIHVLPQIVPLTEIEVGTPHFETWAKKHQKGLNYTGYNLDLSIFDEAITNSNASVPISALWDQDKYYGSMPANWVPSKNDVIGIAEYTNANFFSKDTILQINNYPNPSISDTNFFDIKLSDLETIDAEDAQIDKKIYIHKNVGEQIQHLAAISYLHIDLLDLNIYQNTGFRFFFLDDKCFEEYASHLIPMAVGYNTAQLDYFFRGTLQITPPDQVAYSVTDGSLTPYYDEDNDTYHQAFTSIKAKVRNSTPDSIPGEEVQNCDLLQQNCELRAMAKYKIIPNYDAVLSNYPPDGAVMQGIDFSYSVSEPIYIDSLSSSEPQEFTFDFTGNPDPNIPGIPAGITDLTLHIVFKGTLGNEEDIAVAVGMKDLMEPAHQVFWNATDMFTLDNHLYTSDEIRNDPALAAQVDIDSDGVLNEVEIGEPYIDPYLMTFGIGFLSGPPESNSSFYYSSKTEVQPVEPGRHIRQVVLLDKIQDNYLVLEESDDIFDTSYFYFLSPGVVNQEENGVWQEPTPAETFRYGLDTDGITQIPIRQNFHTGVLACYPMGTDPNGNPSCYYPEEESLPAELLPFPIDTIYYP